MINFAFVVRFSVKAARQSLVESESQDNLQAATRPAYVDPDAAKGKLVKAHYASLYECSRALSGREGGEGGPALFHLLAAAVRA